MDVLQLHTRVVALQIITDFYDKLKSISSGGVWALQLVHADKDLSSRLVTPPCRALCPCTFPAGYASFDYEPAPDREADVVMVGDQVGDQAQSSTHARPQPRTHKHPTPLGDMRVCPGWPLALCVFRWTCY